MDDWYKITKDDFINREKKLMLSKYKNSIFKMLKIIYPDHDWLPWKFNKIERSYWENEKYQREFMDWLGKQLGFKNMNDWYKITRKQMIYKGANSLLKRYKNSPSKLIMYVYHMIISLETI